VAELKVVNLWKKYGKVVALRGINFEVRNGELVTILGPSGAGKTSLLQTIAGVEEITAGEVYIGNELVNKIPPADRNVAMVFETYALYPNKTVFENLSFPLLSPLRRFDRATVEKKVREVAQLLQIDWLLDRNVAQLSGGQRQRVALGRMLVREPKLFLMDEPIAHLDAKLRHRLRGEIKNIQRQFGITTLYTTHDYREALGMGDRVMVLNEGDLLQIGTPEDIYHRPRNVFVAGLVGDPSMNFFEGIVNASGDKMMLKTQVFSCFLTDQQRKLFEEKGIEKVRVGLRPSDISLSRKNGDNCYAAKVYVVEPLGVVSIVHLERNNMVFQIKYVGEEKFEMDERVFFSFNVDDLYFFDFYSEENIFD